MYSECLSQWLTLSKHCFNLVFQSISPVWQEDRGEMGRGKQRDWDDRSPKTALSCASSHKSYMPLRHGAILYSNDQHRPLYSLTPSPMIPLFKGFTALKAPMHAESTVYFSIYLFLYRVLDTILLKRVFVRLMYCSVFFANVTNMTWWDDNGPMLFQRDVDII